MNILREQIADKTRRHAHFFVKQFGAAAFFTLFLKPFPRCQKLLEVPPEFPITFAIGFGAHDKAKALGLELAREISKAPLFTPIGNFARHAYFIAIGHKHHKPTGKRRHSRNARSFCVDGLFFNLHNDFLPPGQKLINIELALPIALIPDILENFRVEFDH